MVGGSRCRVRGALRRARAVAARQRLRAWPGQERSLVRRLGERMPVSTVVAGPLVSIVVVGRGTDAIPRRLRQALDRTTYRPVRILQASEYLIPPTAGPGPIDPRADALEAAVAASDGELVCLLDPAAEPTRSDWLGHLVESLLGGTVAAAPIVIRAAGFGPVPATQRDRDLTLLSAGIDFARASGVALPRHLEVGGDPLAVAGRVVPVPAASAVCLLVRRTDLVAAGVPRGYAYEGVESGPTAAPLFDADLALRLRHAGGTVLRDGRAAVRYRVDRGPSRPPVPPAPSRPGLPADPDRATFLDRWGPRLAREVLLDVVAGPHRWSIRPFSVLAAGAPDVLPDGAPAGRDWQIVVRPDGAVAPGDPAIVDADALVVGGPGVDVRETPTGLVRVAWVGGPDSEPAHLPEFDLIVARSPDEAARIEAITGKPVVVADLSRPGAAEHLYPALTGWIEARHLAIRIGAGNWLNAHTWGDYHFGRMLQRALERTGHPTRVRLLRDWTSEAAARDDATIHVFGMTSAVNRACQVNVLWQISHPDLASPELYGAYDLAYVASGPFATRMASLATVPIEPLHQATDPDRFRPTPGGPAHDLLYVANWRADRPVVDWLVPTGRDLAVYGRGWDEHGLDRRHHRGDGIPNDELSRYYGAAAIVLNDTWADMREAGFIPNRIYDALASGAFVLSDDVAGLERELEGTVPVYRDAADLVASIDRYLAAPATRRALAARGRELVLARHTFGQRAATILAAVDPLLDRRPPRVEDTPRADA